MSNEVHSLLPAIRCIARSAGEVILSVYQRKFVAGRKGDDSPVTEADEQAEALISEALKTLTPVLPIVAEEAFSRGEVPRLSETFWLVDPLDGTREFVSRNGEFTVNIALVRDGVPVLGVVFAPAQGRLFSGAVGAGAEVEDADGRRALRVRRVPAEGLTVVGSRSHGDSRALEAYLAGRRVAALRAAGSSLKFCLVAAGEADLYPRLGRTMEWDTAAGHGVLVAAGGQVTALDGGRLLYGKPGFENPHFVASGEA